MILFFSYQSLKEILIAEALNLNLSVFRLEISMFKVHEFI